MVISSIFSIILYCFAKDEMIYRNILLQKKRHYCHDHNQRFEKPDHRTSQIILFKFSAASSANHTLFENDRTGKLKYLQHMDLDTERVNAAQISKKISDKRLFFKTLLPPF